MVQLNGLDDTIVAISTATGQGAIGIVRLSGKESLIIADQIFRAKSGKKVKDLKTFTVHYGWVQYPEGTVIDEVLLTVMRAPKSYTKEDMVEISCHGGMVSLKAIVDLICLYGIRLAEPGEFTKRAFLNGRIDLTQAEAVLDIIQSKTENFLRVSTNQLKGELSTELERNREKLMNVYVEIEAIVNFPEDEINARTKENITKNVVEVKSRVEKLLQTSDQGRILKDGIKIVICGRPNVGKSSLLNVLLKTERAIVSNIAGTTRDTIEETAQIRGIPFQLIDTAGILNPRDIIEEEAIKRSQMNIESADLVLLMLDRSTKLTDEDERLMIQLKNRQAIIILNKTDLPPAIDEKEFVQRFSHQKIVSISAARQKGIEELEKAMVDAVMRGEVVDTQTVLVSNIRHIQSLKKCLDYLQKVEKGFKEDISFEFISEEIKSAVNCLDAITGKNIDTDLIDNIFSKFCIGK